MRFSDKLTAHLLVKANTNSGWDDCQFAIIHLSKEWKKEQIKRLEWVKLLKDNTHFYSVNFCDTAVEFYGFDENFEPEIEKLLGDRTWGFVVLEKDELNTFTTPKNPLIGYRLVLRANGTAYYTSFGKHTHEEFWTEDFPLDIIFGSNKTNTDDQTSICHGK